MLKTTLGAELLRAELLESNEVNTIFYENVNEEELNQLLNEDDVILIKESIKDFVDNVLVPFIHSNPSLFLAESAEDVKAKLYTFSTFAIKGYLEELADLEMAFEHVLDDLEDAIIEEGIDPESEDAEDILAESVLALYEKAAMYAISKGLGAMEVIEEIRKSTLKKVGAGLAAAGALAGAGYAAYKNRDEIEKVAHQVGSTLKQYGEKAKEKGEELAQDVEQKAKSIWGGIKNAFKQKAEEKVAKK